jgi:hypothetical protein|tara:strand:- start:47 stop:451 length:405 start_codon:yes stop_codon:yes gene_type:complete
MIYKTSEAVFDLLNQTAINLALGGSGKITPFVRNRSVVFPAIVYNVQDEQYVNTTTEIHHREASVEINIMSRSQESCDDILQVVVEKLNNVKGTYAGQCIYSNIDSVSRDYEEAEDSGSNGIFVTTLSINLQIS